jgi:hypothetical protein
MVLRGSDKNRREPQASVIRLRKPDAAAPPTFSSILD